MILFILLLGAVCIVTIPLFRPGFFVSDDGGWMIVRASAFYQSLRDGQFPVRFLGRLNFGYGYPVATFLYPGFMYIGSLIHAAGFSFVDSVKIIFGGSVVLGTVFTFFWLTVYFTDVPSLIGATGFVFAPYLLFDLYHRGSVGEVLAFAFAAMGLYAIASRKKWLFGLAVPLLILSHNTAAFLFLGLYIIYITLRGLWSEFWPIFAAGVGIAAFFWMPAIYERKYVIFDSVAVANPAAYFVTLQNGALVGFCGLIAAMVALGRKKLKKEKIFFLTVFGLTVLLVLPVSAAVWKIPLFWHIIQFPYRMLSVSIFAGAWLMAYAVENSKKIVRYMLLILFSGIGLWNVAGAVRSVAYINEPEGYYTTNEATTNVKDEYMPTWVTRKPTAHAYDRLLFYSGRGTIRESRVNTQTIDVAIEAMEDSVIQVNTIYYPGWGATVDDAKVHIDYANNEGVMRMVVPAGKHHLVVAFRETISRFLADVVSVASLIIYTVLVFI